jgi:hypothetical protein
MGGGGIQTASTSPTLPLAPCPNMRLPPFCGTGGGAREEQALPRLEPQRILLDLQAKHGYFHERIFLFFPE